MSTSQQMFQFTSPAKEATAARRNVVIEAGAGTGCAASLRNGAVSVAFTPTDDCKLPYGTVRITNGVRPAHVDVALIRGARASEDPAPAGSSISGYGSERIAARSESQRCVRLDSVTVMVEAAVGVQLACMRWHWRRAGVTTVYAHM